MNEIVKLSSSFYTFLKRMMQHNVDCVIVAGHTIFAKLALFSGKFIILVLIIIIIIIGGLNTA